MSEKYSISIILPVINEINSLIYTLKILKKIKEKKEFLIIYSKILTSKTNLAKLNKLKKNDNSIKIYKQIKPYVGGAIMCGINKSKKKYIVIMASDLETNPHEVKRMIKLSKRNPRSIISADRWISKGSFNNYGIVKFVLNFCFQKLIKLFYNFKILDFTFAFRLYPSDILKKNKFIELRHGFALEMLLIPLRNSHKVITIPSKWKSRSEGKSSITLLSYISYLKVLIRNL